LFRQIEAHSDSRFSELVPQNVAVIVYQTRACDVFWQHKNIPVESYRANKLDNE